MCTYTYAYTGVYTYVCVFGCVMAVYMHTYVRIWMSGYIWVRMYIYVCAYGCICIHIRMGVYRSTYVCVYSVIVFILCSYRPTRNQRVVPATSGEVSSSSSTPITCVEPSSNGPLENGIGYVTPDSGMYCICKTVIFNIKSEMHVLCTVRTYVLCLCEVHVVC